MRAYRRSLLAQRSTSSPMWRVGFAVIASSATVWGAGCSDDDAPLPAAGPPDAGPPDTYVPSPPDAASTGRDCANDLNDDGIWTHLDCTGLYSSFASKTLAEDAKPFKPAAEFWSDGAAKQRWVRLPAGKKIDISDWNEWQFPPGTKFWKEFKLGGKRIETRLFAKRDDGSWVHTSYRWNADETDAVAKNGGESIPGLGPDGGTYEIPNAGNCEYCHFGRKDQILGFDAVSLGLPGATGQTLEKVVADGWLSAAPSKTSLVIPDAPTAGGDKAKPAVAWLSANCGSCHNNNANAAAFFFPLKMLVHAEELAPTTGAAAAFTDLDVYVTGYCKSSGRDDPDESMGTKFKYLNGTKPAKSLMSILSGRRVADDQEPNSGVQMPPIVTRAVDFAGHALLDEWITALPACPP